MAVHDGDGRRAVVPIENSLEGGVAATLDALAGEAGGRAHRRRGGPPDPPLPDRRAAARAGRASTRVVSHPQATAQCARFLRERLPQAERVVAPLHRRGGAVGARRRTALGRARLAAGGRAVRLPRCWPTDVEDQPDNVTRFVWLAPAGDGAAAPGGRGQDLDRLLGLRRRVARLAGGRAAASSPDRDVNLTRIESRPRRVALGHYMFFADLEGARGRAARERGARGPAPTGWRRSACSARYPARSPATPRS